MKNLHFISDHQNILFLGSPKVGKSRLAIALSVEASSSKTNLIHPLYINDWCSSEWHFRAYLEVICPYGLLIIDEISFLPFEGQDVSLLFQLLNLRYENIQPLSPPI